MSSAGLSSSLPSAADVAFDLYNNFTADVQDEELEGIDWTLNPYHYMDDKEFIKSFRLTKSMFCEVVNEIRPFMKEHYTVGRSIDVELRVRMKYYSILCMYV